MEKRFLCQKYSEYIDIDKNPCPHPNDYCQYRMQCIINTMCMEDSDCRKKRRKKIEDT